MSRDQTIGILNDADSMSSRLNWILFVAEQEALLYGESDVKWMPGDFLPRFTKEGVYIGVSANRPLFSLLHWDQFSNYGGEVQYETWYWCTDCGVGWDDAVMACWMCETSQYVIKPADIRRRVVENIYNEAADAFRQYSRANDHSNDRRGDLAAYARRDVEFTYRMFQEGRGPNRYSIRLRDIEWSDPHWEERSNYEKQIVVEAVERLSRTVVSDEIHTIRVPWFNQEISSLRGFREHADGPDESSTTNALIFRIQRIPGRIHYIVDSLPVRSYHNGR